ncbi:hypothetical protein L9F63_009404, partial [Diploptera punctata]
YSASTIISYFVVVTLLLSTFANYVIASFLIPLRCPFRLICLSFYLNLPDNTLLLPTSSFKSNSSSGKIVSYATVMTRMLLLSTCEEQQSIFGLPLSSASSMLSPLACITVLIFSFHVNFALPLFFFLVDIKANGILICWQIIVSPN